MNGSTLLEETVDDFRRRSNTKCSLTYKVENIEKLAQVMVMKSTLNKNYLIPLKMSSQLAQDIYDQEEVNLLFYQADDQLKIKAKLTPRYLDWRNAEVHNEIWIRMYTHIRTIIDDKDDYEYVLFEIEIIQAILCSDDFERRIK
ncbi:Hypothetical_protein [Hexamita inflata]|uniref:Hypothetical_protein n=1 Tax=Hexamita inflata TaxID=28002 RepID=A0AA86RPR0_9EUKA|nr:Hypothetical protein HINF_LOCUS66298 [Hexamita inflata]